MSRSPKILASVIALSVSLAITGCDKAQLETAIKDWGGGDASSTNSQPVKLSGKVQSAPTGTSFKPGKVGGAPYFAKSVSGTELEGTPIPNTLVLVSDAWGNTQSDTASTDGSFDVTLDSGKAYAVIFIDTKSMKVIGSLVQASNTDEPGAVSLADDTNLGNVVVDTQTGKAVSQADATPTAVTQKEGVTLKVVAASTLDTDGDGKVTTADINNLQGSAIAQDPTKLKSVTVATFMGDPDTWTAEIQENDNANWNMGSIEFKGGKMNQVQLVVRRARSVTGPAGTNVVAVKSGQVNVYQKYTGDVAKYTWDSVNNKWGTPVTSTYTDKGGYFNYTDVDTCDTANKQPGNSNWSWCGNLVEYGGTALSEFNPNATATTQMTGPNNQKFDQSLNDYINGWARYNYAYVDKGYMYEGEVDRNGSSGQPVINWRQNVPLNLTIGATASWTVERKRDEFQNSAQICVVESESITIVPTVEPTIVTDSFGNKLPVMLIKADASQTNTYYDGACSGVTTSSVATNTQSGSNKMGFYIVGRYGVQIPAFTPPVAPATEPTKLDFATEFAKVARFGILSPEKGFTVSATENAKWTSVCGVAAGTYTDVKVCETTPKTVGTATVGTTALPITGDATTKATRDSWILALAGHIDEIDRPRNQGGGGDFAGFWVERNADGQALEPISWDPNTYVQHSLVGGTSETFTTTLKPDSTVGEATAANYNIHFRPGSVDPANIEFYMELRTFDPNATNPFDPSMKGGDVAFTTPVKSTAKTGTTVTSGITESYGEYVISLSEALTPPNVMFDANNDNVYKQRWQFWEESSAGVWTGYCSAPVSVWIVMSDKTDPNNVQKIEQPVGWYMVRSSTAMGANDTCTYTP